MYWDNNYPGALCEVKPLSLIWRSVDLEWPGGTSLMAPGKLEWNFRHAIIKEISVIDGWVISWEIALIWMSLDSTEDQSTLVQVMAWCLQATSHYLSQCWPRSLLPYSVTRPQWVNQDESSPSNACQVIRLTIYWQDLHFIFIFFNS